MSTWKGISHARMTRSMHALRGGEYKVLAAIRRLIPDGERRKISQLDIADRAGVSEGTVSAAMRSLDGAYIKRHYLGRGRGRGYEIEVLPPPEQRAGQPVSAPAKGSNSELSQRSFFSGIEEPQTPPEKTSDRDPSILMSHAHEQQQQPGGHAEPADEARSGQAAQGLAPETIAALQGRKAHAKTIANIAARFPGLRPAQVEAAYLIVEERSRRRPVDTVEGLLFSILADGQMPTAPRPRPDPPPEPAGDRPPRKGGRRAPDPLDTKELASRPEFNRAEATPPPVRASPNRKLAGLWQTALGLLRDTLRPDQVDSWLRPLQLAALADGRATLAAPSSFVADGARSLVRAIDEALSLICAAPVRAQITLAATAAD